MVDRAHLEKALAVGQLEIAHLQDDREHFAEIHNTERQQQNGHFGGEHQSADNAAEEERTGVAHEYLGRVEIPNEKAEARTGDRRAERSKTETVERAGNEHDSHRHKEGDGAVETVYSVGEVDSVDDADNDNGGDDIVEEAEVNLAGKRNDHFGAAARKAEDRQICRRGSKLENQLLRRGQTEVALFDDLGVVIHKADDAVGERQAETGKDIDDLARNIGAVGVDKFAAGEDIDDRADDGDKGDRDNKHDAAHNGSALLFFVPAGTDLQDRLSEIELVQVGDQKPSRHCRNDKCEDRRAKCPNAVNYHFYLPFRVSL